MSREGTPLGSFLCLCKVHLILKLFFSPFPVVFNLIIGKSYFAKMLSFKISFDKIIHKVLGIIIRNFGV